MLSVIELLKAYLIDWGIGDVAVGGVTAGAASNFEQEHGVLSLTDAGIASRELYTSTTRRRISIRCLSPTVDQTEQLSRLVIDACHRKHRVQQRLPSDGQVYLILFMEINGGPTMHRDSEVTWEMLVYVELWVHTIPVGDEYAPHGGGQKGV
jgi:hypothetical protein